MLVRMWPSLSRITPLPPPVLEPFDAMMVTVEGRTFFAVSATPATVEELLILELTEPREEALEELLFDAAMPPPTPAPTPPPTRAASRAAVSTTPAP